MNKYILLVVFCLLSTVSFAQESGERAYETTPIKFNTPTPASITKYEQVPVSLSSGTINLNIPLYNLEENGISIPISLQYDGSGLQPNNRPSWVGSNWSLNAGGVITRVVNGIHDEIYESDNIVGSTNNPGAFSYLDNYNELNRTNWIDYFINMNSGTLFGLPDLNPDEFYFSMNGYSGSFFLNHTGEWVVKSNNNAKFKIEALTVSSLGGGWSAPTLPEKYYSNDYNNEPYQDHYEIGRYFYSFKLTTPDGIIYTFGQDINAIDFTNSRPLNDVHELKENYVASAWKLTKIQHPNGTEVNFNYERKLEAFFIVDRYFQNFFQTNSGSLPGTNGSTANRGEVYKLSKLFTTYLTSIETSDRTLEFNRVDSNQLDYDWIGNSNLTSIRNWLSQNNAIVINRIAEENAYIANSKWPKLDEIVVKENNIGLETIKLIYNDDDPNIRKRLFLKEVRIVHDEKYLPYKFSYNTGAENIPYATRKVDHWGYYNGFDYLLNPTGNNLIQQINDYKASRNSNFNQAKKGSLKNITYPTGLSASFGYELHTYSKVVKKSQTGTTSYEFDIENQNQNKESGGLRIKSIHYFDLTSSQQTSKLYSYKDEEGVMSSGILGNQPNYFETGAFSGSDYWIWASYPVSAMSESNGSHIQYSVVKESSFGLMNGNYINNGYKIYNFTNFNSLHDNGLLEYLDKPAIYYNGFEATNSWKYDPFDRHNLLRGKILQESVYNDQDELVSKIENTYTIEYGEPIRAISKIGRNFAGGSIDNYRMTAYETSTPFHYISQKRVYSYYQDGLNPIVSTFDYQYHSDYKILVQESFTNSKNEEIISRTDYPFNFYNSTVFSNMISKNMIVFPVHKYKIVSNKVVEAKFYEYINNIGNYVIDNIKSLEVNYPISDYIFPSVNSSDNVVLDDRMKLQISYKYDLRSNLVEQEKEGVYTSYLWSFNYSRPIAKILNASFDEVINELSGLNTSYAFMQDSPYVPNNSSVTLNHILDDLRDLLPHAHFSTYNYYTNNKKLIKEQKDVRNQSIFYRYDQFNRLNRVADDKNNLLMYYKYVYKNQKDSN
ncbi:hypothetical protein [Xanthomarina gelatinilytica]|uniref:hypothetical protein n=1 Tax=Xanthomarina gelatinilytica TaxID=1137281 RepID=UPI003AA804F2